MEKIVLMVLFYKFSRFFCSQGKTGEMVSVFLPIFRFGVHHFKPKTPRFGSRIIILLKLPRSRILTDYYFWLSNVIFELMWRLFKYDCPNSVVDYKSHYVTSRQVALKLTHVCINFYVCNITALQCSFNKVKTLTGSLTAHVIIYSTSIRSGAANIAGSENSIPPLAWIP